MDERVVNIVFKGQDKTGAAVNSVEKSVAGLDKTTESMFGKMAGFSAKLTLVSSLFGTIKDTFGAGFGMAAKMESSVISMAASMQALGASKTFTGAMAMAKDDLQQMTKLAAALPGEASEYATVLQMNMSEMLGAGMKHDQAMLNFTARYTAVAKSLGVASDQAARDLGRIIQGSVGMDNITWMAMKPYLGKEADRWKGMSQSKRIEALNKQVAGKGGKFDEAIAQFGNTFESAQGTIKSFTDELQRNLATPVFETVKKSAVSLANYLSDEKRYDLVMRTAQGVGQSIADFMEKGFAPLKGIDVGSILTKIWAAGPTLEKGMQGLGTVLAGLSKTAAPVVNFLGNAVSGLIDFGSSALPGVIDGFQKVLAPLEDATIALFNIGNEVFDYLYPAFSTFGTMLGDATSVLGDWLSVAVVPLKDGMEALRDWMGDLTGTDAKTWRGNYQANKEVSQELVDAGIGYWDRLLIYTQAASAQIGLISQQEANDWMAKKYGAQIGQHEQEKEAQRIESFLAMFQSGMELGPFRDGMKRSNSVIDEFVKKMGDAAMGANTFADVTLNALGQDFGDELRAKIKGRAREEGTKPPKPVVDMRGAHFTIKNEFAEGFDLDRVAVSMMNGMMRLGEQRLQAAAGTLPLFSS